MPRAIADQTIAFPKRQPAPIVQPRTLRGNLPRTGPQTRQTATSAARLWYRSCKRLVDVVVSIALLIITTPILLIAALLIKITSVGPIIYSQGRMGKNGKDFTIYKLRTMVHNCESLTGPRWCIPGDPRVTPLGAFLRASHIDELPQLWNVIRGDMSLIGPRPERREFLPLLQRALPRYRHRLRVRPGVTGLAQVQLPPDTDLASVRRKLACDLFYVENEGPWLDFQIMLCTASKVLGMPLSIVRVFVRLPTLTLAEATVDMMSRREDHEYQHLWAA